MEPITQFQGPSPDDYANVTALNVAYIKATSPLKRPQRARLAAAPFLLFSVRERDLEWWQAALQSPRQAELTDPPPTDHPEIRRIQTAALGFLWHLASQNPYAARIITGGTTAWCEQLIEPPLVTLLERVAFRSDLSRSRLDDALAARLLGSGTSARSQVRRSSQLNALQVMLTQATVDHYARLPQAACNMSQPQRVHDKKI